MELISYPSRKEWTQLLKRPVYDNDKLESVVSGILVDVRLKGDAAIKKYTLEFDGVNIDQLEVTPAEFDRAEGMLSEPFKKAVKLASANIEKFHKAQKVEPKIIETTPGVKCWQKSLAIEKVGLYVPGGSAPLFSTVLMLAIPARIAGCREIVLCTPPAKDGSVHPAILHAAKLCGVTKVFKVGGVQAIGAMTFGTETIPSVYKIFGPGNQYVMAAKQLISRLGVAIDMPAGPSEVAVIADETCNPAFVASDLLSQAEHGADSQVLLFTTSQSVVESVQYAVNKQLIDLPRKEIATKSLKNSRFFVLENWNEVMDMVNEYAPEHLIISTANFQELSSQVINAGSVFLGNYAPESAGDYASGTNHTLPTNGYAKAFSGVNLDSFVKKVTFQEISEYGMFNIGPAIELMAHEEKLDAHKNAVSIRLSSIIG